jgi:hypothetical protein
MGDLMEKKLSATDAEKRQSLLRSSTKADLASDKEDEMVETLNSGQDELRLYELIDGYPDNFRLDDLDL